MNMNDEGGDREVPGMQVESGMIALLNKSEIDQQIATAHRFPRSLHRFAEEALQMVTLNAAIAEECIYALPRKEKDGTRKIIEGPSARFAEIIVSAWGNSRAGARVVDDRGDFVTAQGVFHDLERNVAITYEVQRRITGSNGRRYSTDMIGVTANAACSIALRNAILKGIPKAFWSTMYAAARKVIAGDVKTLASRRENALAEFMIFGISEAQVCAKLEVAGTADITIEHLVILKGLLNAIREGDTTPEQAFAPETVAVEMPRAKTEAPAAAQTAVGPSDAQNPVPETTQSAAHPEPEGKPAAKPHAKKAEAKPLSASLEALLDEACRKAGVTRAQLAERYPVIDTSNYNAIRDELLDMAAADESAARES